MSGRNKMVDTVLRPALLVLCVLIVAAVLWRSERTGPSDVASEPATAAMPRTGKSPVPDEDVSSPSPSPASPSAVIATNTAKQAGLTIDGTVVDSATGSPIPWFEVSLLGAVERDTAPGARFAIPSGAGPGAAETMWRLVLDEDGRFTLAVPEAGRWCVGVSAPEYNPARAEVSVRPGGRNTVALRLEPGAAITGRIVNTSGAPIAGATVYTKAPSPVVQATTESDEEGYFRLTSLTTPTAKVTAKHKDYQQGVLQVATALGQTAEVELILTGYGVVEGQVRTEAGPVVDAKIVFPGGNAVTDAFGMYEIKRVPPRRGNVRCTIGEQRLEREAIVEENRVTAVDFVAAGFDGAVEGTITVEGQPASDASVVIDVYASVLSLSTQTKTDEMGRYVFAGLPAGEVVVTAEAPANPRDFIDKHLLRLAPGEAARVDFDLGQPPGRVAGAMTCAEGAYECLVVLVHGRLDAVDVRPQTEDLLEKTATGNLAEFDLPGGEFVFDNVAPGRYTLLGASFLVDPKELGWEHLDFETLYAFMMFTSRTIEVGPGQEVWVELAD